MANTFKSAASGSTTSIQTLYTCPVSTTAVVHAVYLSNIDGTNDATVNLYVSGSAGSPQVGIGTTSPGVALEVIGTISGSATSTGSFGRVETAGNINTVGRIYESGTSVIDHATAMAIVFGG